MNGTSPNKSGLGAFLNTQMTPAARYGLVVLLALLGVQGLRLFYAQHQQTRQEANYLAAELEANSDEALLPLWTERAETAEAAAEAWSNLAWRAPAPGIAAAKLEAALRLRLETGQFDKLRLEVDPEPVADGKVKYLRFRINGQLPRNRAHALLAELSASNPIIRITDLQFARQGQEDFTVEVEGLAPFLEQAS